MARATVTAGAAGTEKGANATIQPVEARLKGDLLSFTRLVMTVHNKRMPICGLSLGRGGDGALRATLLLDCPREAARRYATLLSGLEDVEEAAVVPEGTAGTVEVALVETGDDGGPRGGWREAAARAGVGAHEEGGTVVGSGEPAKIEAWLSALGAEDHVRLGPTARPGKGGF